MDPYIDFIDFSFYILHYDYLENKNDQVHL